MVTFNSLNNKIQNNDFTQERTGAGVTSQSISSHTDNTSATSDAKQRAVVGGAAGGDPYQEVAVSGTTAYAQGIDNSVAGDPHKFTYAAAGTVTPSTGTVLETTQPAGYLGGFSNTTSYALEIQQLSFPGLTLQRQLNNLDTTNAASHAQDHIRTELGGGDPYTSWIIGGAFNWVAGQNRTDNSFRMGISGTPSTLGTTIMVQTINGERTMPFQPAFLASLTTTATNVTGAGATYTLNTGGGGGVLTEIYDQNADFNPATGTFTAPVTGIYFLHVRYGIEGLAVTHTSGSCTIVTAGSSAQTFQGGALQIGAVRNAANQDGLMQITAIVRLVAADTVTTNATVSGGGAVADVTGTASPNYTTYFQGYLIC